MSYDYDQVTDTVKMLSDIHFFKLDKPTSNGKPFLVV